MAKRIPPPPVIGLKYPVAVAAQYLNTSSSRLWERIGRGEIPVIRTGAGLLRKRTFVAGATIIRQNSEASAVTLTPKSPERGLISAQGPPAMSADGQERPHSGAEFSGNSAWEASVRSRLYFGTKLPAEGPKDQAAPEKDDDANDTRYLTRRKTNYARANEWLRLTYRDGVLVPDDSDALTLGRSSYSGKDGPVNRAEAECPGPRDEPIEERRQLPAEARQAV